MLSHGHKILVVDDEPSVARIVAVGLTHALPDVEIACTSAPAEAVEWLKSGLFGVVVADLAMPEHDGVAVLRAAHAANPATVSILMTGRATTDALIRAINDGHLWRAIEKPFAVIDIKRAAHDAVQEYNRRVAARAEAAAAGGARPLSGRPAVTGDARPAKVSRLTPPKTLRVRRADKDAGVATARLRHVAARYTHLSLISEGGSGAVYRAQDNLLNTPVAIKIIATELAGDAQAMRALVEEARIVMQLSHENIVRLHNVEQSGPLYYLVMEYIEGHTLRDVLRAKGALAPSVVRPIMDVCENAIGYAHRLGIYHRDLKPDNFMLRNDRVLKIIDFGLACLGHEFKREGGEIGGTPLYMSPEEARGLPVDARTDIYSLGITLHELLTGRLPSHHGEKPPADALTYAPVAAGDLAPALRVALDRAYAREPARRWPDIHAFAAAFRAACAGDVAG